MLTSWIGAEQFNSSLGDLALIGANALPGRQHKPRQVAFAYAARCPALQDAHHSVVDMDVGANRPVRMAEVVTSRRQIFTLRNLTAVSEYERIPVLRLAKVTSTFQNPCDWRRHDDADCIVLLGSGDFDDALVRLHIAPPDARDLAGPHPGKKAK